MAKIQAPKGTKDVLPGEVYKWHMLERVLRSVADDFGCREIRFPTFEHTELFLRSVGETTDIVNKEMYSFVDKGGRDVTLRPEGTASVVRAFMEHALHLETMPVKVYYIAPNFRYEKPQAGRLREHHQFGVEFFGADGPDADAEVISLANTYLHRLGITNVIANINSIGCPDCRPNFQKALVSYFESKKDTLCETCLTRLEKNPLRILDCKSPVCAALVKDAPQPIDYLCADCEDHFTKLKGYLTAMEIPFVVNPFMVRGLDYYTKTVFEFISTDIGAQGTVCGGGRYDALVESMGGPKVSGLGFGSGMERLLMVMEAVGAPFDAPPVPDVFLASMGEEDSKLQCLTLALRRLCIKAERDLCARSFKAQLKYANKIGAKTMIVFGSDEWQSGKGMLKNMQTGEQTEVALTAEAIAEQIKTIIK